MSTSVSRVIVVVMALAGAAQAQSAPSPSPSPPPPADAVSWRYDKGFIAASADEKFELKLGLRTQTRLEVTRPEAKDELEGRFLLPRIRLQLEGFAYGKANRYKLEYDAGNQGFSAVKDFFVERALGAAVNLRAGQWKKPFSRQELTSDFALALIERQASGGFAGAGRDLGVALHSGYERSPDGVEWAVGVFNGTTEKSTIKITCTDPADASTCKAGLPSNVPTDFLPELVARVGFNHGGIKGYSELDLEGGPLRLAAAAAYRVRFNDLVDAGALEQAGEVDALLKVEGFDLSAALFLLKVGEADADLGGYVQAGYVAVPRRLAVVARAGSTPSGDKNKLEYVGGVNLLAEGHSHKLVVEGGASHDTGTKADDLIARAQAQLVF